MKPSETIDNNENDIFELKKLEDATLHLNIDINSRNENEYEYRNIGLLEKNDEEINYYSNIHSNQLIGSNIVCEDDG